MKEFYLNVDATRKNYIIISPEHDGRVHVEHDCKTDEELGEMADYSDFVAVSSLEVGESCPMCDGCAIVVRIA